MSKFRWDRLAGVGLVIAFLLMSFGVIPLAIGQLELKLNWDWGMDIGAYGQGLLSLIAVVIISIVFLTVFYDFLLPIIQWFFEEK